MDITDAMRRIPLAPRTPPVTENRARMQLRRMLGTLTAGSILHLLAELFAEQAEAARRNRDDRTAERCDNAEATQILSRSRG